MLLYKKCGMPLKSGIQSRFDSKVLINFGNKKYDKLLDESRPLTGSALMGKRIIEKLF